MNQCNSFEFSASIESLRGILVEKTIPEHLLAPFQALLKSILESGDEKSLSIYLHSDDDSVEIRSYFAYALAKTLIDHIPSAVVVDSDFLNPGMAGVVPQKDALGFLDFLLYGSSLGVVTQELPDGLRIIGAGSFPLTKKMPVSSDAFEDAARRLGTQSRLVIFCGPSEDDECNIHPVAEMVDLPIYLSYARNFPPGRMDPFEEKLADQLDSRVISVRITGTEPVAAVEPEEGSLQGEVGKTIGSAMETAHEPADPEPPAPEFTGLPFKKKKDGSLIPKIITYTIGALLVVFLVWWLIITQWIGGPAEEPAQIARDSTSAADRMAAAGTGTARQQPSAGGEENTGQPSDAVEGRQVPPGGGTPSDNTADRSSGDETGQTVREEVTAPEPPPEPESDRPSDSGGASSTGNDVCMVEDFTVFGGMYLVHVSSFRTVERAVQDVIYLNNKDFDACVVPVDLGSKGHWYRVYAGPLETREEARELKIMLDELPRVTFTRITRAPGGPR